MISLEYKNPNQPMPGHTLAKMMFISVWELVCWVEIFSKFTDNFEYIIADDKGFSQVC